MKRFLLVLGFSVSLCSLVGCDDKTVENSEEKIHSPRQDYTSRVVMACPKCGAPQKAYRINAGKSYYRCSGMPPKFPYHSEELWSHGIDPKETSER